MAVSNLNSGELFASAVVYKGHQIRIVSLKGQWLYMAYVDDELLPGKFVSGNVATINAKRAVDVKALENESGNGAMSYQKESISLGKAVPASYSVEVTFDSEDERMSAATGIQEIGISESVREDIDGNGYEWRLHSGSKVRFSFDQTMKGMTFRVESTCPAETVARVKEILAAAGVKSEALKEGDTIRVNRAKDRKHRNRYGKVLSSKGGKAEVELTDDKGKSEVISVRQGDVEKAAVEAIISGVPVRQALAEDVGPSAADPKHKKFDAVAAIMAYEQGDLDDDGIVELFRYLVQTGTINHLQGSYQRAAREMIKAGLL